MKVIKNHSWIKLVVGLIFLIIIYNLFGLFGPSFIGGLHFGKGRMTDEEIDKLINPSVAKNYKYPAPSSEAINRKVSCNDIYYFKEFPRTNPLCVNIFKTSAEKIIKDVESGTYDRIVLYGDNSVFDAPTSSDDTDNYLQDLFQNVKFMDQIAIPKLLLAYGLSDVNYIKVTKPYPYLYYRISNQTETNEACSKEELASGCARNFYAAIIPLSAIGPQLSSALPIVRQTDKARFSYLTQYPADCYANGVFLHETSHLLNAAGGGMSGKQVMASWLNEQIAGYLRIYGPELVCGERTVTIYSKPEIKDVPKALIEFNSVFAAADLSHGYPKDNLCRQAMLTSWYRYLAKGDYKSNFRRFFVEQRKGTPSIVDDTILADFLSSLDPGPTTREFLQSKGCLNDEN